jgi:competence protein ComEC
LCAVLTIAVVYGKERDTGKLSIYFLDVGQGDAMYIRTPSGRDMLIDGGPSSILLRRLSEVMPWYDRSIDVVMATHPDADHIGGFPELLKRYRVGVLLESGVESDNSIDDELIALRKKKGIESVAAKSGVRVNFGDGAHFDVIFPDTDVSKYETNAASIVGWFRYGSTSAMLTGDSPKTIENRLLARYGAFLKSDILKAGHHGSRTSSGKFFVEAVSPQYAIISAAKDNRYGHPHKEVMDILESANVEIFRTDETGTVRFISDGRKFTKK